MIDSEKFHGAGGAHTGLFGRPSILRAPEPAGGGGSGGGDDEGMPKTRAEWVKLIGEIVHGSIGEREKRATKATQKLIADTVAEAVKGLAVKPEVEETDPNADPATPPAAKKGALPPEFQAELSARDKKLQGFEKQLAESKAKEAAAEKRAQAVEERNTLTSALTGKVKSALLDDVVDMLHSKRITRDPSTGKVLWKADGDDEVLPIEEGVAGWLATPKGKEYVPAREAAGGGSGRGTGAGGMPNGKDAIASDGDIGNMIGARRG